MNVHYIFDCDDVLLNWQSAFAMYLGHRGIVPKSVGPTEWCLSGWLGCTPQAARAWVGRFNGSDSFAHMAPMKGAYEVLWALHDTGHTIDILTACGDSATTRQRRWSNLVNAFNRDRQTPFQEMTCVPLGASKSEALTAYVMGDRHNDLAFCEDNYDHARTGARMGIKSFCLRRSHNLHREGENPDCSVIWIDEITDVLEGVAA